MPTRHEEDEDVLYVQLSNEEIKGGLLTDDHKKTIDLDVDNKVRGVMFLYVSDGVDLEGIPEEYHDAVNAGLEQFGIRASQPA